MMGASYGTELRIPSNHQAEEVETSPKVAKQPKAGHRKEPEEIEGNPKGHAMWHGALMAGGEMPRVAKVHKWQTERVSAGFGLTQFENSKAVLGYLHHT